MPFDSKSWTYPSAEGLYDPALEKDACGVGFIVNIDGRTSHDIFEDAAELSRRMEHRGACSADNDSGDGAGVLIAIPKDYYQKKLSEVNVQLPRLYATGIIFCDESDESDVKKDFEKHAESLKGNLRVIHWREVPKDSNSLGSVARASEPKLLQVFVTSEEEGIENKCFDKYIYILRKTATHYIPACKDSRKRFYICSLSRTAIVYKGQFNPCQIWNYFTDLMDPEFESHLLIVHTRFSTNTFPSWERAHPNRVLAHNGEINTLRGNVNLMEAREGVMVSPDFEDLSTLYPIVEPDMSDSGCLDNVVEFLVHVGDRSLPEAMMTLVPEAWQNDDQMPSNKKNFYHWASFYMEPWDGPALLTFTDGRYVGAILDRNGLRPSRYYITKNNRMIMASEVGVIDIDPTQIIKKGRLQPGKILLVDTDVQKVIDDHELKSSIASSRPHGDFLNKSIDLKIIKEAGSEYAAEISSLPRRRPINLHENDFNNNFDYGEENILEKLWRGDRRLPIFGYNIETLEMLMLPMFKTKKEALGSMGNDTPLACLSEMQPLIYEYFKQLFAQVTNPPIDPFREKIVMSLECPIGPEGNILNPGDCTRLWLKNPILSVNDLEHLKRTSILGWKSRVIDITYLSDDQISLSDIVSNICNRAEEAVKKEGVQLLILSDRNVGVNRIPVSAALASGAVHHHLIATRLRSKCAIIVESGEAREVHHLCVLIGFGADAICPYMVLEIAAMLKDEGVVEISEEEAFQNYVAAVDRGISKVMAKMGISTMQSYKGAQIFEALGISTEVVDKCFRGAPTRIGGVTFDTLSNEASQRHFLTFHSNLDSRVLRNPGFFHWRSGGEEHINDPASIAFLQEATKYENKNAYQKYVDATMETIKKCSIRGQFEIDFSKGTPVDVSEVELASNIVKRFVTGAMSFGSISAEAHGTLAVAMNKLGGKSNTGEGGENEERYLNDIRRSAIKQVASGRFGVSASYLAHADELQIKMAQGAKPGEGGELPGYKVTVEIAKTRRSVPGVGLISPPPHHDIYSIEDLAQLIYDLKCINPKARISVKLVSEVGVGVIAAGVAKGKAEHILISGHDGGTGASSWTGIKGAGLPWELGIAETHQTLVMNNLRSRVVLQTDGQLRTGFDVMVAGILGADEFGFSTAPLIVLGCTMMRKCHLNTCPVGIATQDPILRKKFEGQPEHVVNYFFLIAEEIREFMAKLGCTKFNDLIGHTEFLKVTENPIPSKTHLLNFNSLLHSAESMRIPKKHGGSIPQDFQLNLRLDNEVIKACDTIINSDSLNPISLEYPIVNTQRTFGATLSYHIAMKYNESGLPRDNIINISLHGSGGQSLGAFLAKGVSIILEGDSNDYVGKCLSGGHITVFPPKNSMESFKSEENIIVGNVCLYGATSGRAFFRGIASERFCVRNSGAVAVVEGVGDHGCEYMTGGRVIILGTTGRNFAAGMSGGIAYVVKKGNETFETKCNMEMVELVEPKSMEDEDKSFLLKTLQDFVEATGSEVAAAILSGNPFESFIKVYPMEYRQAIENKRRGSSVEKQKEATKPPLNEHEEEIIKDIEDLRIEPKKSALDKTKGFMKYPRVYDNYRDPESRTKDWDEIYDFPKVRKSLKVQAARCMDCGVPFCHSNNHGCPLGNVIPRFNDLVFHDQWKEALKTLLQTNNFPEFTGRVCPAPCEGSCVLGINSPPVTIKNIECAIIDKAFENGWIKAQPPLKRSSKTIAIIGSGPSGLAAADQLNKAGHNVTVYERNNRIGGLLQYGIPSMKLSKEIVQRRVDLMTEEGINFKVNSTINESNILELKKEYDALLFCTGSTIPRDIPIPGRKSTGIHFAMEFLQKLQQKNLGDEVKTIDAKDLDVIVIGGGDTGNDCIASSLRQGAKSITTFEILPQPTELRGEDNPWPQFPRIFKVDYGHQEVIVKNGNDPRRYSTMSKEFLSDENGRISGIRTVCVSWEKDDKGRWVMSEVPNSEKLYPAQLVLLCMGFLGPDKKVLDYLNIELDPRGNIQTKDYAVGNGIFAAGDCRRGQSLVVWAITEGRQAARKLDEYLIGSGVSQLPIVGGVIVPPV
uniref:glutamate synthase (NADH) n=1 Tax=Lepeophtheirus salmonis TaxID=72036 RepID=A0A0K2SWT2_LEPSM